MSKHDHTRVTPEGRELGTHLVRLTAPVIRQLAREGEPDERCASCAFRAGTVPNGCLQTMGDALKCVLEGVLFTCHMDPAGTKACHGWFAARVALAGQRLKMSWEFSPEEPVHGNS